MQLSEFYKKYSVDPRLLAFFLVFIVSVLTYMGLSHHQFVEYDDWRIIVNRIDKYDGFTFENFLDIVLYDYPREEPLVIRDISYLINSEIFGSLNPQGYLLGNLILHIFASYLIFVLFLQLYPTRFWPAILTAIIFAIHPIHVESVAWISSRKDTLYSCFFILSFLAYLKYTSTNKNIALFSSYCLFFLAIFSKSAAIAFFPVILFYRLIIKPGNKWTLAEAVFYTAVGISTLAFVKWYSGVLTDFGVLGTGTDSIIKESVGTWVLLNAEVITFYLGKLLYPAALSIMYDEPSPGFLFSNLSYLLFSLSVTGFIIFYLIKLFRKRDKRSLFLCFWFIGTILPYLNLADINIYVADRYVYLASFSMCAFISLFLGHVSDNINLRSRASYFVLLPVIVLCALLINRSIEAVGVWKNSTTFWTNVLQVAPRHAAPYSGLTRVKLDFYETYAGTKESFQALEEGKRIALAALDRYCTGENCPQQLFDVLYYLGKIYYFENNWTVAETYLRRSLSSYPDEIYSLYLLTNVLLKQGKNDEAFKYIKIIERGANPYDHKEVLADIKKRIKPLLIGDN